MTRLPRYIVLVIAAVALVILIITSSVVRSKGNDLEESESYLSSRGTMEPTLSPFTTPNPTDAPSLRPSFGTEQNGTFPSQEPTIEVNDTEPFLPTNFTESPAPTYNSTFRPSFSSSPHPNSSTFPSLSPFPTYWNDTSPSGQPAPSFLSILPTSTGSPSTSTIDVSTQPSTAGITTNMPIGQATSPPTATNSSGNEESSRAITESLTESSTLGTRFYAIGDVPYTRAEANELNVQIANVPQDAEFVIHVGDIRTAKAGNLCTLHEYHHVAGILNQSHAPVFIVLGGEFSIFICRVP